MTQSIASASPSPQTLELLTPPEQVRFWEASGAIQKRVLRWLELGDPICLGEARKLLAPPPPPEPPPQALETEALLSGLPGRPDRIAAVAGRLAEELGDPKSYHYYHSVAELVCRREQPPKSLIAAWRQGRDPRASRPGAVFATAWKREVRLRD
jgi:hypothetical protein